jgi:hypothetical protein
VEVRFSLFLSNNVLINLTFSIMEPKDKKITFISEDIRQVVENAYGDAFDLLRLCKDHPDPLLYHDEMPVLNITQDELVGTFDLNKHHFFISAEQVVRFAQYCKLALPYTIALILKAEWEVFVSETAGYSTGSTVNLRSVLTDKGFIDKQFSRFAPDTGRIIGLINKEPAFSDSKANQIEFYVLDLLKEQNFLIANESIKHFYPDNVITERLFLNNLSTEQQASFLQLKELWHVRSAELDDKLLFLERKKKINLNSEGRYFRIFGTLEIAISRLKCNFQKFSNILHFMKEHPEFPYRKIVALANSIITESDKDKNDIKNKFARSLNYIVGNAPGETISAPTSEFVVSYMQDCKKLLRKLFFLLHSDSCPGYAELTEQKKGQINTLWIKLMKSTKNEFFTFSPNMVLYNMPDYEQLLSIYYNACEILNITPDNMEPGNRLEFMIRKGLPFEKIMSFLNWEIESIGLHLAHLELVQSEYTNEDQTQAYIRALEDINGHTEKLKNEIAKLKSKIKKTKVKIVERLLKVAQ